MENQQGTEEQKKPSKTLLWVKRLGFAGFMFFLIKGLVWVGIFLFAAKSCD